MNINELGEDLEQQFGKPRNITEENVRFMLSLIKEEFDGTKVNENVEKPSLEAFGYNPQNEAFRLSITNRIIS